MNPTLPAPTPGTKQDVSETNYVFQPIAVVDFITSEATDVDQLGNPFDFTVDWSGCFTHAHRDGKDLSYEEDNGEVGSDWLDLHLQYLAVEAKQLHDKALHALATTNGRLGLDDIERLLAYLKASQKLAGGSKGPGSYIA